MVIVCRVIVKPSYNNSENYKDKYFECLMCAGHFQCLNFRHFGVLNYIMLVTVTVNHRHTIYQKHTVRGLWNTINLNCRFGHINFHKLLLQTNSRSTLFYSRLHKRNLRYLAKVKNMVKQCNMINHRKSSQNDNH